MIRFSAEFVTSAFALDGCPRWKRAEVALAGRSNVGKSSLLNALAGVKGLARTSKTPGRTRCLNFFAVGDTLALCDLPGFGYAKMSHEEAARIASMMHEYIHGRVNLAAIAILIDCRRGPQADELELAAMAAERGIEVIAVATKCDKLRRSERAPRSNASTRCACVQFFARRLRRGNRRPAPPNPCGRQRRRRQTRRGAMTPAVSVIIPTYNRRAMLIEAIDSVLAQTARGFELIVIDDGSTDGTNGAGQLARLAETIRFERIDHRGPAAARNRGVALARAPLIAFLDSDDLWSPAKLERQLAFMSANPGCAISQTDEIWIRNGRRVNPGMRHRKRAGDIFIDSLRTCLISTSAVMMRTDLFRSLGGFDELMTAAEDYDLWLRILIDHEAGLLDEPLVTRRGGHPDQTSATTPALDRFRILALTKLLADDRLSASRRSSAVEVLAEKCRIYAGGLRRRGQSR